MHYSSQTKWYPETKSLSAQNSISKLKKWPTFLVTRPPLAFLLEPSPTLSTTVLSLPVHPQFRHLLPSVCELLSRLQLCFASASPRASILAPPSLIRVTCSAMLPAVSQVPCSKLQAPLRVPEANVSFPVMARPVQGLSIQALAVASTFRPSLLDSRFPLVTTVTVQSEAVFPRIAVPTPFPSPLTA
jgi:hypothetical protein